MTSRGEGLIWLKCMRQQFWRILKANNSHYTFVGRTMRHLFTLSIALVVLGGAAHSQQQSCTDCTEEEVEIGFQGKTCPFFDYTISLNGAVASGFGNECVSIVQFPSVTQKVWTKLQVNKPYTVSAGTGLCITNINFDVPPEYVMYINGFESNTIFATVSGAIFSGDGSWEIVIRKRCPRVKQGGQATNQNGSVIWDVGMGNLRDGRYAEDISIREKVLSPSIYTPAALVYAPPGNTSEVDVVKNPGDSLRQVRAPQAFADIVTINSSEYEIRYYQPANVGSKVNGLYTVTGQPYVTWKFTNPNPGTLTKLRIEKIENGVTTDKSEYTWDSAIDSWSLNTGWSPITQTYARTEIKSVSYPTQTARTETFVVKESDGQIVSKRTETYFSFPWGEKLVQRVLDPDAAALTTTYTYFENPSEIHRYRKLKSVVFPNGSWEKYDYDIFWNIWKITRPWKDLSMAAATESNSHLTIYGYTNSDNGVFGISEFARIPWDIEEKINGITVRKTRYIYSIANIDPDMISVADSSYEGSNNGVPVNLISQTVTTKYRFSAPPFLANRVGSVVYPDGRKDTYTYEQGNYIPNADPSLAQFVPDANGLAERQTLVHGTTVSPDGIAFKTTKETLIRDQSGNHVLEEEYVYNGAGYERVGWSVMDYDNRGHLIASRNSKSESTSAVWIGERKTSEIDGAGTETVYTYDSLGRVETQRKKGVTAFGGFPSQDDIVTTFIYDADGRQKTETQTGGTLGLSSSRAYDKAGRLIRETDPALLSTAYTYPNGGRTQTVTRSGGATEISDTYLDGQAKSRTGSAIVPQYFDYGVNADGTKYEKAFTGNAGLSSPRWTKKTTDWIGRTISTEKPSFTGANLVESFFYNSLGQLQKKTITANSTKLISDALYEYDDLGRQTRKGLDVDNNGSLTLASTDRISETDSVYEKTGNDWFQISLAKTYLIDNNSTPVAQTQRRRLNNFPSNGSEQTISETTSADVQGNVTKTTIAVDHLAKKQISTIDRPDSATNAVSISVNGLLQSATSITPKPATTYTYDALGRNLTTSDPSMATNVRVYDSEGRLQSTSSGSMTTAYEYYPETHANAGRRKSEINSFNKKTYSTYNNQGQVIRTWGDATYPTEYVYDAYGQKTELHTFRGGQNWKVDQWPATTTGTVDTTKWIYQESTGLLTQKLDAAQKEWLYTYDELGRIKTRVWARGITCTYGYDSNTGELLSISYSDSTPAVSFTYDRGGRQKTATDAAGLHTRTFNAVGRLETEQITGGILDGVGITIDYDNLLRRNSLQTSLGANTLSNQTYGYDASSRVETVTSGSNTATFAYHPNSGLLNTTTFSDGTVISRGYDSSGRFQTIALTPDVDAPKSYTYIYNDLNQITRVTRENGSYWSYNYNDRGELVFGRKYWSDDSVVWGAQTEYDFDNIGNRIFARTGGNQVGSLRQSNYSSNSLNQYLQRTVPGAVDVTGTANTTAAVSVNNQATARKADYFYKELAIDNSSAPLSQQISVVGARNNFGAGGEDAVTQKGGRVLVPRAQENLTYDDDGNLTTDGQWNYTWDAENRLVSMESVASVPVEVKQRLEFAYDHLVRRIQKKTYLWNTSTSTFQLQATIKFIYDGWDLVAEVDGSGGLIRNYARTGAGLLFVTENNETHAAASDSNQNIVHLVRLSTGQLSATYEYDPFGNLLQATGDYANKNPFRFAGKYFDAETGLTYYGHRYYDPQRGRWTTRDPIAEAGGLNLYAALRNDLVNRFDPDGRAERKDWEIIYQDWAGLEILRWLCQGEGNPWWIINDRKWADYMMTPANPAQGFDEFRTNIMGRLWRIAQGILNSNVPDGHQFRVDETFSATLENGEHVTGYNFLNTTNEHAGDFQIQGSGTKVMGRSATDECQEVNFRVQYSWHDIMDPNFTYWTDVAKWAGLKMLYYQGLIREPVTYDIHIIWSQESTYRMIDRANVSTGWPFKQVGSPPR